MLAPEALKKVHQLGKSPVITDENQVVAESGAILSYLEGKYNTEHRLKLADQAARLQANHWLQNAEGSLMHPLIERLLSGRGVVHHSFSRGCAGGSLTPLREKGLVRYCYVTLETHRVRKGRWEEETSRR